MSRELYGIDDPSELKRLEETARLKDNYRTRSQGCAWFVLLGGAVGAVARLTMAGWAADVIAGAVVGMAVFLWGQWVRKRIRMHLPEVLRQEGRCCSCGYNLKGLRESRCPECGTPLEEISSKE